MCRSECGKWRDGFAPWINILWRDSINSTPTRCSAEVGIFSDNLFQESYTTRPFSLMHPEPEEKQWTVFAADFQNARRFTLTSLNSSSKLTTFLLHPKIILKPNGTEKNVQFRESYSVHLLNTRWIHHCSVTTMIHINVISSLNEIIILVRSWLSQSSCCFSYYKGTKSQSNPCAGLNRPIGFQ